MKKLVDLDRCMVALSARWVTERCGDSARAALRFVGKIANLYKLSFRTNGKSSGDAVPSPGTWMHLTLLKTQSTLESCQSWSTEMSVSVKDGTQRTFRIRMRRHTPL